MFYNTSQEPIQNAGHIQGSATEIDIWIFSELKYATEIKHSAPLPQMDTLFYPWWRLIFLFDNLSLYDAIQNLWETKLRLYTMLSAGAMGD